MRILLLSALGMVTSLSTPAQDAGLLDVFSAQVKPDKIAEFEAAMKRIVDANRKHNGSHWIALTADRGSGFTYNFVSSQKDFADIEKSGEAFGASIAAMLGNRTGMASFFHEFDKNLAGSHSGVRRRRPDLSANMPSGSELSKAVGKLRYVDATVIHIRSGYLRDYEEQIKTLAAGTKGTVLVSQSVLGDDGNVYYVGRYLSSLSELDEPRPRAADILGPDGYQKYLGVLRAAVSRTEHILYRVRPDLSVPTAEVAAVDPAFWNPRPPLVTSKPKPVTEAKR